MDFDLTDKDVEKNISRILESMSAIRREAMKNNALSDDQKDEYLHLTYRLASSMEPLASESTLARMNSVAKMAGADDNLLYYDPLQSTYWKSRKPAFVKTLELAAIGGLRDRITSMDQEHHVFQAIKYLAVHDSSKDEIERVYSTILPYHGLRSLQPSMKDRLLGKLFGCSFDAESDGTVLKIKDPVDISVLHDVVKNSRNLGYSAVRVTLDTDDIEKAKALGGQVKGASAAPLPPGMFDRFLRHKWLSYPVLGALSESTKKEIEAYAGSENFNSVDAMSVSWVSDFTTGATLLIWGFLVEPNNYYAAAMGSYSMANFAGRTIIGENGDTPGNLHGKIASPLFDAYLASRKKRSNRKLYDMEIPLSSGEAKPVFNAALHLRDIAQLQAGSESEESLVARPGNFHNYGKKFAAFLEGELQKAGASDVTHASDRISGSYSLVHSHSLDGYKKYSHLACAPNRRYVFSSISETGYDPKGVSEMLLSELSSDPAGDARAKLEKLSGKAAFAHLTRYDNCTPAADFESVI